MKESQKTKKRLDNLLVEKGLVSSRNKAQALIMSGVVDVDGVKVDKSGTQVNIDSEISIKENEKYVSRGGLKLEKAINEFGIDVKDKIALDIGASTGGFTDCMLQNGVTKVYAYDVGYGQLDWKIRNNDRVLVKEKINCRYLKFEDVGEKVDLITIDVSFISLDKIVPNLTVFLNEESYIIALIKPQFEVEKDEVDKGGIIKDLKKHEKVINKIKTVFEQNQLDVQGIIDSPILGKNGNKEYLICGSISPNP